MLNDDNYHSMEMNRKYMSASQYKDFLTCEARTMAKLSGEWVQESTPDCIFGSLLHAWNEGVYEDFINFHPELYSSRGPTKGQLLARYQQVNEMIHALETDPLCMEMLAGQKEVIFTAEMYGTPWKIKIDTYRVNEAIVDLKTTKSIWDLTWSTWYGEKVSFIENFNYMRQLAIYCEIERKANDRSQWLPPYIVAISKESPPDKAIISLADNERLQRELDAIGANMQHILAVKNGFKEPVRCERCAYCRSTKKVEKIISYHDLEGVSF